MNADCQKFTNWEEITSPLHSVSLVSSSGRLKSFHTIIKDVSQLWIHISAQQLYNNYSEDDYISYSDDLIG